MRSKRKRSSWLLLKFDVCVSKLALLWQLKMLQLLRAENEEDDEDDELADILQ